ncbi:MAG: DUF4185 domain-containing protein [Halioglobus sp.]|nr:DUF4185 domain-containing protein [Halioglobus sp.]
MKIGITDQNRLDWLCTTTIHFPPLITTCALFLCCFILSCGSGGGGSGTGGENNAATSYEAPPGTNRELVVRSVRDIGAIGQNPLILQRDAGFSVSFQGKSQWLFGDTLLEFPNSENALMLSNSLSATYDIDAGDGIAGFSEQVDTVGAPPAFFPLTEAEQAFNASHGAEYCRQEDCLAHWHIWPGTMIVDENKGLAYVFYRKVLVEAGPFEFSHVGHSIAVWKDSLQAPERPVFNYVESYPTLFFSEEGEYGFGSAAVAVDDDVYVYGCELAEDSLQKPCHLARVAFADILDKSAWSYYGGDGNWSSDISSSSEIFLGNDMMSVFFSAYLKQFLVIYSEPFGAKAMLRSALRPEGPRSAPMVLFSVEATENAHGWVYDFLAHPEFSEDGGRIVYVSYSRKTDETHSQLQLVAVELGYSQ